MIKEDFVWRFRTWLYIIAILAILTAVTIKFIKNYKNKSANSVSLVLSIKSALANEETDSFWPPDIVPHPHPPQPEPKKPEDDFVCIPTQGQIPRRKCCVPFDPEAIAIFEAVYALEARCPIKIPSPLPMQHFMGS